MLKKTGDKPLVVQRQRLEKIDTKRVDAPVVTEHKPIAKQNVDDLRDAAENVKHSQGGTKQRSLQGTAMGLLLTRGGTVDVVKKVAHRNGEAPKRVGVFLGTFNPPHAGHRATVERMKKEHNLDLVYVIPDKSAAYKKLEALPLREQMVEALFDHDPSIKFAAPDSAASGEMWDVLKSVNDAHPGANVFNILGSDTVRWWVTLPQETRDSAGGVQFLVNDRHDGGALPTEIDGRKVHLVQDLDAGLSSTQMRAAIAKGEKPDAINDETWALILANKLYGVGGGG